VTTTLVPRAVGPTSSPSPRSKARRAIRPSLVEATPAPRRAHRSS
jgi:hypothetical protein